MISAAQLAATFNEALKRDPKATKALFQHRVIVNEALRDHPTIQVGPHPIMRGRHAMGLLGLVNGALIGNELDPVAAIFDEGTNELVGFRAASRHECGIEASVPGRQYVAPAHGETLAEASARLAKSNREASAADEVLA